MRSARDQQDDALAQAECDVGDRADFAGVDDLAESADVDVVDVVDLQGGAMPDLAPCNALRGSPALHMFNSDCSDSDVMSC